MCVVPNQWAFIYLMITPSMHNEETNSLECFDKNCISWKKAYRNVQKSLVFWCQKPLLLEHIQCTTVQCVASRIDEGLGTESLMNFKVKRKIQITSIKSLLRPWNALLKGKLKKKSIQTYWLISSCCKRTKWSKSKYLPVYRKSWNLLSYGCNDGLWNQTFTSTETLSILGIFILVISWHSHSRCPIDSSNWVNVFFKQIWPLRDKNELFIQNSLFKCIPFQ